MPKAAKRKPTPSDSPPGLEEERLENEEETTPEGGESGEGEGNGHTETEEPATMQVTIKGTASGVRSAARKVAGDGARPTAAKPEKEPPEDDGADALLADPKNMIVVARQLPRVFTLRSGEEVRCAVKVEKYTCPITRDEIEEDVFERFGGRKYKATIHPNTTTGENMILGAFTMEHPNPEMPPYLEDPETPEEAAARLAASIPSGSDPTMRETDNLAEVKARLHRRLERAETMKEIKEMERLAKQAERDLESDGKPVTPAAPAGPDPKDAEIARLREALAEKKVDDRFNAMQNSIADLSKTVQALINRPVEHKASGEGDLVLKMFNQSQTHSKEMLELVKTMSRPTTPTPDASENFDKMLDRFAKMKTAFGGDDSRVSKLQDQLLEMAMDRVLGGGEEGGEEEDTMKFAIKQFTPVLKTYVEKQVEKEERTDKDGKKQEVSKERLKEIYQEAAGKAAKDLEDKWRKEGWLIRDPKARGGGAPGLPAPQKKPQPQQVPQKAVPSGKVVARKETPEGIVEHIQIEPTDLSKRTAPKETAATTEAKREEVEEVQYTDMPGIGKVEVPAKPGEMKYDRKKAVNYVLNSILSEINEGTPQKAADDPKIESYIPADALEFLDNELLAEIHRATSGDELEETLGKWGDREKLDKIKEAGRDKAVDSWIRRAIRTTQDIWRDQNPG
jgi:hypothetical protein